ncbi:Frataxin-like protein [Pochonia chlamydosporia 170]|uniref:ferroxidase n=1 Tax=Pochonia chlamydosporia 170 TaxID=1380566 RepID=A0A179G6K1_METCM|nr:Frataxin-like protein [Pochonia chlamydosporia 170]OAQ73168.1 Frataxin-like protein [Pochonia chlamydosporia 170]
MSRQGAAQISRLIAQASRPNVVRSNLRLLPRASTRPLSNRLPYQSFSTSPQVSKGIMPETDNPGKQDVQETRPSFGVVELSDGEYHELADSFLEVVLSKFEQLQDAREDIDIEYSSGVMTINVADKGTYVINKQPPNKQIWLSSPISGPKRYDWCIIGEGQGDKEGTGSGNWIYGRDGVSLPELILEELDVVIEGPATS